MEPMLYAKGISWIDDCRIPFVDETDKGSIDRSDRNVMMGWKTDHYVNGIGQNTLSPNQATGNPIGRFPANVLVCDDILNDGNISKSGYNPKAEIKQYRGGNFGGGKTNDNGIDYGDKGTNSRYYDIDKWFDKILNYE